jgi:hypothetical protein
MDVGEGRTSVNLDGGSFRDSVFQIPLPQGNEVDPECPLPAPVAFCVWLFHVLVSAEGVAGCEVVGDIVLLANEPLRG